MMESCLTLEPGFYQYEERTFFDLTDEVFVLGRRFLPASEAEKIKEFVTSRLWFTYRRNFPPIGGTGPTSDHGWGCMLRCGQMLLAQALMLFHVDDSQWIWKSQQQSSPGNADYERILRMFQDKKQEHFSLHQIAQMGVSEGKQIGEWFGPNTVAQVLKKLVIYDTWTAMSIHVALDNLLIHADVHQMATTNPPERNLNDDGHCSSSSQLTDERRLSTGTVDNRQTDGIGSDEKQDNMKKSEKSSEWRPVLIIVPLRLGLTVINRCYIDAIRALFQVPQCVGIIGGRPNHALYFIGMAGEKLLYLDPHECQNYIDLDSNWDDTTFHCPYMQSLAFDQMDPSLAVGFMCSKREQYEDLVGRLNKDVLKASSPPLFELLDVRPKGFPRFIPYVGEEQATQAKDAMEIIEDQNDSDDQFCILDS